LTTEYRSASVQLHTLGDFIRWGASRFREAGLVFGHGMASALDESAYLVLHALHLPVDTPELYFRCHLTTAEKETVLQLLERRIRERKPAAYLTQEGWFAGLPFFVDERVLVPRSPLAEWVEKRFEPLLVADEVETVLDLCTGSGCIGIACAYAFPQAQIDLADISPAALEVAAINIERHHLGGHVQALASDLFAGLQGRSYDLIISNPPYVDAADLTRMGAEFHHEPALGLAAGQDGLAIVHRILREADQYLSEQGVLVVEVGNSQFALQATYPEVAFQWLEFERGGDGVFALDAAALRHYRQQGVIA